MIPQRNISLLSNRLARKGGRRIPEAVLERDYCLSWFLVGLSRSALRPALGFKGGTALKKCYFGDYRFSEDLDFTLIEKIPLETLLAGLEAVYDDVRRASGIAFRFSREDRRKHRNSHTFYMAYEGPLPGPSGNEVKVDITMEERIVYPLKERTLLRCYEEYSDLPRDALVLSYTLEEIALEKTASLLDPARSEPRDLYDLWYLTSGGHVDLAMLLDGIRSKLAFHGLPPAGAGATLDRKEPRLRRLWSLRLSPQMVDLPGFDEVNRSVRRSLRQGGLLK